MFQACFEEVTRILREGFEGIGKKVSMFQKFSKKGSRLFEVSTFNNMSKVFQGSYEGVSRKFCFLTRLKSKVFSLERL